MRSWEKRLQVRGFVVTLLPVVSVPQRIRAMERDFSTAVCVVTHSGSRSDQWAVNADDHNVK